MCNGRTVGIGYLVGLPAFAGGIPALSLAALPSLAAPALLVLVPGVPGASGASAEGCVMAYSMAVIAFLVCCRAVATGMVVTTSCVLDDLVRCGGSALVY